MIRECIRKAVVGMDLSEKEMGEIMTAILAGAVPSGQTASLLTALRMKGESVDEIVGAAKVLRERGPKFVVEHTGLVSIDRDEINVEAETMAEVRRNGGTKSFNISTATALVLAGGGVPVLKCGHCAVSSLWGSADVVESLGIHVGITPSDVERCLKELGIGFYYAPLFQGAMGYAASTRVEMGIRTLFNLLSPLMNPGRAKAQVLGVYDPRLTETLAHALARLGVAEAMVVFGEMTFDEISLCGPTRISLLSKGCVETHEVTPEELGFQRVPPESIQGGDVRHNAEIIQEVLNGRKGPHRDLVLLNAAAGFVVAGLDIRFQDGIIRAAESIDSGQAKEKLRRLMDLTGGCRSFVRKELSS